MIDNIVSLLGDRAEYLLKHNCQTIPTKLLHLPGPDWVDRIFAPTNRNQRVLNNLNWMYHTGRLAGTGYLSILPVDQGIEHSAGASFAKNPLYFDPENIVKLAIEGAATPWHRPSAFLAPSPGNMPTRFLFSSKSTTTSCSLTRTSIRKSFSAR